MAVYIERTSDERVRPLKSRQPPEGQQKRSGPMRQVDGSTEKPHGRWFDGTSRLFFFRKKKTQPKQRTYLPRELGTPDASETVYLARGRKTLWGRASDSLLFPTRRQKDACHGGCLLSCSCCCVFTCPISFSFAVSEDAVLAISGV